MAITVEERRLSPAGSVEIAAGSPKRTQDPAYIIRGTEDEGAAMTALGSILLPIKNGLALTGYRVQAIGHNQWDGFVNYGLPSPGQQSSSNPFTFCTFATSGGTEHITQSKETQRFGLAGGTSAPNFHGAIGVTETDIEGVDVVAPKLEFSLMTVRPNSMVTIAFVKFMALSTGKTNLYPWLTFERGELIFLGCEGSQNDNDETSMSYRFAASQNAYSQEYGGAAAEEIITVDLKRGWEYLWFRYKQVDDTTAKRIVRRPIGAYVERVYHELDYASLGVFL